MPEATQSEVGRRLYHVHREKKVERAIKHMQQGTGPEWKSFSEEDIRLLSHLLQCTWNVIDQDRWDKIPFASIKMSDVPADPFVRGRGQAETQPNTGSG